MAEFEQDQLFGTPVGERLRVAREEKGLSLDDIARQTRIPIRHLEHIERGEWDALPALTYSVGFARSYANCVGLDGPAIGAELREHLGGLPRAQSAPAAYYEPADPARVPPWSLALIAAVIAALLVVGYMVWRKQAVDDPGIDESPIADAPAPAPKAALGPAAPAAQSATGPVVLTATSDVWLRIYSPDGTDLYKGMMRSGERYQVPAGAAAPLIRTGRPNALQIDVGTTRIPPLGQPEQVIANVSLKPADLLARLQGGAQPGFAQPPAAAPPAATPPSPPAQ